MADEQEGTQGEMPNTPAPESGGGGASDAAALQAELEEIRKALKAANSEAAERRKKLEAYEKAEEDRKLAEMSEIEKAQKRAQDAEALLQTEREARRNTTLQAAVTVAAMAAGFHNPADAWAFLPREAVTVDDDNKVQGVDEALKTLVKDRPYLVKAAAGTPPSQDIDGAKRGTAKKTPDLSAVASKYGIQTYD